ncbi:DUF4352 domain-containing protein [Nocardia sp. NPDC004068]|uniref:DUF4352 domain-containing protein n=1 Tax=Nocardia sp. NPDC004068 TaxID=3364303 RepID=UPI0036BB0F96
MTNAGWPPPGSPPPGWQPVQPYPGMPPKKGAGPGRVLLIVLGVIILGCFGFGVIGAMVGGKDTKTASSATARPAPAAAQADNQGTNAAPPPKQEAALPGLNTPVRDGKFEFVVTNVETGLKVVGDNPFLRRTAQGAYTIVTMTVTNTSDKPHGFSPSDQYVFDQSGRKFENDGAAAINLQPDTSLYASVNPGNKVTAQVVFDLPADAVPRYIVLHDSMFSGGGKVALQ